MHINYPTLTTADLEAIEEKVRTELARRKEELKEKNVVCFETMNTRYEFNRVTKKLTVASLGVPSAFSPVVDAVVTLNSWIEVDLKESINILTALLKAIQKKNAA